MSLTIQEMPEDERPREKLALHGPATLSDAELIAIILRTGIPGCSAIEMGRRLIAKYGSLGGLSRCTVGEISSMKGVGPAKAVQLVAAFGLAGRLARQSLVRQRLDTPELINEMLGPEMRQLNRESLRVILLDTKLFLLRVHEISLGSLNESLAHPREILQPVIGYSAHAFILVHNHPSGDPTPSDADRRLTIRMREASNLLQVNMLDHVILGTPDDGRCPWFSFRKSGLL